jgi:hypothetical protein
LQYVFATQKPNCFQLVNNKKADFINKFLTSREYRGKYKHNPFGVMLTLSKRRGRLGVWDLARAFRERVMASRNGRYRLFGSQERRVDEDFERKDFLFFRVVIATRFWRKRQKKSKR